MPKLKMCQSSDSFIEDSGKSINDHQHYVELSNGQRAKTKKIQLTFNMLKSTTIGNSCWLNEQQIINYDPFYNFHNFYSFYNLKDKRSKWISFNWITLMISEFLKFNSTFFLNSFRFCNLYKINSSFKIYILIVSLLLINTSTIGMFLF